MCRNGKERKRLTKNIFYFYFLFSLSSFEMPGVNVDEIVSAVIASIRSEKDDHKKLNVFLSYPFSPLLLLFSVRFLASL